MKKRFLGLLLVTLLLLTASCGKKEDDKYADYKHYKLENFNKYVSYDFISGGYNEKDTYVVADITPEQNDIDYDYQEEGIFYKISDNDYILLKTIKSMGIEQYNTINTYFYQDIKNNKNNIYLLRNIGGMAVGFTVNKEKISSLKLNFDTSKIKEIVEKESDYISSMSYSFKSIENVTSEFIYFDTRLENLYRDILVKCSFESLVCEKVDN